MVSRYYRNRRLGEFLKELSLTEGRNTSIPTIQRELARNGSPAASFETDEDRLSFLVRIPCHEGEEGISSAFMSAEANNKENQNDTVNDTKDGLTDTINLRNNSSTGENDTINSVHDTINDKNDTINDTISDKNDTIKNLTKTQLSVYKAIQDNPSITRTEMKQLINLSTATIGRTINDLKIYGLIERAGGKKSGKWVILK